ncbi:MAG: hypothetical protein QOH48_2481 [Actinomycetota bacterium]|nr:hypothetical protein [Actinomycetota bacterium]
MVEHRWQPGPQALRVAMLSHGHPSVVVIGDCCSGQPLLTVMLECSVQLLTTSWWPVLVLV